MGAKLAREEMIQVILRSRNREFLDEITHQMSVEREYAYDEVAAAFDTEDRAETWVGDGHARARFLLKAARLALIDIGFYRQMSRDEIENTYTSNGRSPWAFKMDGIAYTHDDPAEPWMFPEQADDGQELIA